MPRGGVMNDPNEDPVRRDSAAQAAAPYVHARLAPKPADPDEEGDADGGECGELISE